MQLQGVYTTAYSGLYYNKTVDRYGRFIHQRCSGFGSGYGRQTAAAAVRISADASVAADPRDTGQSELTTVTTLTSRRTHSSICGYSRRPGKRGIRKPGDQLQTRRGLLLGISGGRRLWRRTAAEHDVTRGNVFRSARINVFGQRHGGSNIAHWNFRCWPTNFLRQSTAAPNTFCA